MTLSSDEINDFIKSLGATKLNKEDFYEKFFDYVEKIKGAINEKEEADLEAAAFEIALKNNLIGYDILLSLSDTDFLIERFSSYVKKNKFCIFHFFNEKDDEKLLCLSKTWEKWNNLPPLGWIGTWCPCGSFYPNTLDMGLMDLNNNKLYENCDYKVREFHLNEVHTINFCSDGFIRFIFKDGSIISAKPFKYDKSIIYNFIDNPLEI